MRHLADIPRWCDDVMEHAAPARFARRSVLKAAVLGRREEPGQWPGAAGDGGAPAGGLVYTVTGTVLDASPHVLVLRTRLGDSASRWLRARRPGAEARSRRPPSAKATR